MTGESSPAPADVVPVTSASARMIGHRDELRHPVRAAIALLAIYVALSFVMSPQGFLGTDTGGKVATLETMTTGPGLTLDPDLGYWAEGFDPGGRLHPVFYTSKLGDRWVNVTTLPVLLVAAPLYDLGGYRAALALPMFGAVAAALAAAAVARRLGGSSWLSFWAVGVASPMTIYAVDFWEHSIGAALMVWAVVLLWDLTDRWHEPLGRTSVARASSAGALLGFAATLRSETLVVTAAAGVVVVFSLVRRRVSPVALLGAGLAWVAAFTLVFALNAAIERALLGVTLRGSRAGALAVGAGDAPDERLRESMTTVFALVGNTQGIVLGAAFAVLLAYGVWRSRTEPRLGRMALAGAGSLLALRVVTGGVGFVPGLFAAWPFAAAGVVAGGFGRTGPSASSGADPQTPDPARADGAVGTERRGGFLVAVALLAMPVILASQFRGGAAPQWAGRYLLACGLLLTAVGLASVPRWRSSVGTGLLALSLFVTLFGAAWLSVRSHAIARTIDDIEDRPEDVIVSTVAHLAREGGATYGRRRWLTAVEPGEQRAAAEVVRAAGDDSFALVSDRLLPVARFAGWEEGDADVLVLFDGVVLFVRHFDRV